MKKRLLCLCLIAACIMSLFTGCGKQPLTYTVKVSGNAAVGGVIYFLDYSINVYENEASNPCGDCAEQPVHLYAGASAEETAQAMADVVNRADDLWKAVSVNGGEVVFQEKTAGSIDEIPAVSGPEGLLFASSVSGRNVTMRSEGGASSAPGNSVSFGQEREETVSAAGAVSSTGAADRFSGNGAKEGNHQGEQTALPENPQRLAAVYGPSYELLAMLGAEERIVVRADVQTDDFPWAERVFQRITEVPALTNVHTAVSFEQVMKYSPDLVYSFPRQNEISQLEAAGVAVLPGQAGETLEDLKAQVRAYGGTLGEAGNQRAELYCSFFDSKLQNIKSITDTIPENERKKVYYAGIDILTTYGKYSDLMEVIEAAGGIPVSRGLKAGNRTQIDYEQLMAWDPDVIFIDHGGINDGKTVEQMKEELLTTPTFAALSAVKNDAVYLSPSGVFYWDMGLQKILLVEYMAKVLYPDRFPDLDMEEEVMNFYQTFYGYDLSRGEAAKILNRQPPE